MSHNEHLIAEYRAATHLERSLTEEAIKATNRRSELVRLLHGSGLSYAKIGEAVGLSWQRVQQLANR